MKTWHIIYLRTGRDDACGTTVEAETAIEAERIFFQKYRDHQLTVYTVLGIGEDESF